MVTISMTTLLNLPVRHEVLLTYYEVLGIKYYYKATMNTTLNHGYH